MSMQPTEADVRRENAMLLAELDRWKGYAKGQRRGRHQAMQERNRYFYYLEYLDYFNTMNPIPPDGQTWAMRPGYGPQRIDE